jgi:hypothetical protein
VNDIAGIIPADQWTKIARVLPHTTNVRTS